MWLNEERKEFVGIILLWLSAILSLPILSCGPPLSRVFSSPAPFWITVTDLFHLYASCNQVSLNLCLTYWVYCRICYCKPNFYPYVFQVQTPFDNSLLYFIFTLLHFPSMPVIIPWSLWNISFCVHILKKSNPFLLIKWYFAHTSHPLRSPMAPFFSKIPHSTTNIIAQGSSFGSHRNHLKDLSVVLRIIALKMSYINHSVYSSNTTHICSLKQFRVFLFLRSEPNLLNLKGLAEFFLNIP